MSMVTIVLALASRAPITILAAPVAGLDVVAREQFYDVLLADYAETGRTFIISTHIIEEAAGVFADIIFIDNGRVIETGNCESFVAQDVYKRQLLLLLHPARHAFAEQQCEIFKPRDRFPVGHARWTCLLYTSRCV